MRDAIFIIAVDGREVAVAIAGGDDAALVVGVQEPRAAAVQGAALILDDRLIRPRPPEIAP